MDPTQSPDRKYIHEAIEHVAELGYLTLPERRVLLRNTIKILRQSQNIDNQPLPLDEQAALRASPKLITSKEHSIAGQIGVAIGSRKLSRKFARKAEYVSPRPVGRPRKLNPATPKPVKKHWWNNGKENRQFPIKGPIPAGWKQGRTYHQRDRGANHRKARVLKIAA
jgi:hypothetical protein